MIASEVSTGNFRREYNSHDIMDWDTCVCVGMTSEGEMGNRTNDLGICT